MRSIIQAITGKIRTQFRVESAIKTRLNRLPERGMWVTYKEKPAILTNIEAGDVVTIMMVDPEEGTNIVELHVPGSMLRQCLYTEIPTKRRPPEDVAASLGYYGS